MRYFLVNAPDVTSSASTRRTAGVVGTSEIGNLMTLTVASNRHYSCYFILGGGGFRYRVDRSLAFRHGRAVRPKHDPFCAHFPQCLPQIGRLFLNPRL
jgi:hypothetical protein